MSGLGKTMNVRDACSFIGISASLGYQSIKETGLLAGVPVIRVAGRRGRILIPTAALLRVLEGDVAAAEPPADTTAEAAR